MRHEYGQNFEKNTQLSNFMKIRPVAAADTQMNGQTLRR